MFRNPNDADTYINNKTHKGHNTIHLSAFYDLQNHIYTNVVNQPANKIDERGALIKTAIKHTYIINFTRAVQVCRKYLRLPKTVSFDVEALICKFLNPVRVDRTFLTCKFIVKKTRI